MIRLLPGQLTVNQAAYAWLRVQRSPKTTREIRDAISEQVNVTQTSLHVALSRLAAKGILKRNSGAGGPSGKGGVDQTTWTVTRPKKVNKKAS